MDKLIDIPDLEFDQVVLKSTLPVLVDFWAPWCNPCKAIAPILESIARKHDRKLRIVKVNTDNNPRLLTAYKVRGIPTLLFFSNGKLVDRHFGMLSAELLEQKVSAFLKSTTRWKLPFIKNNTP